MIGEIAAVLGLIVDFAEDHPDVVKMLAGEARDLLTGHEDEPMPSREAQAALAAGMAARASVAVQQVSRRQGVSMERARATVEVWAKKTTARNQLLLQQEGLRELCAELLHDMAALVRT